MYLFATASIANVPIYQVMTLANVIHAIMSESNGFA